MPSTTTQWMKIGDFLFRRLMEAGVRHLFGVPGDYNLVLLQQLQDTGALKWVGTCSELNAAGDGSFQLTAQELSTILRHDHKPVIFLDQQWRVHDRTGLSGHG